MFLFVNGNLGIPFLTSQSSGSVTVDLRSSNLRIAVQFLTPNISSLYNLTSLLETIDPYTIGISGGAKTNLSSSNIYTLQNNINVLTGANIGLSSIVEEIIASSLQAKGGSKQTTSLLNINSTAHTLNATGSSNTLLRRLFERIFTSSVSITGGAQTPLEIINSFITPYTAIGKSNIITNLGNPQGSIYPFDIEKITGGANQKIGRFGFGAHTELFNLGLRINSYVTSNLANAYIDPLVLTPRLINLIHLNMLSENINIFSPNITGGAIADLLNQGLIISPYDSRIQINSTIIPNPLSALISLFDVNSRGGSKSSLHKLDLSITPNNNTVHINTALLLNALFEEIYSYPPAFKSNTNPNLNTLIANIEQLPPVVRTLIITLLNSIDIGIDVKEVKIWTNSDYFNLISQNIHIINYALQAKGLPKLKIYLDDSLVDIIFEGESTTNIHIEEDSLVKGYFKKKSKITPIQTPLSKVTPIFNKKASVIVGIGNQSSPKSTTNKERIEQIIGGNSTVVIEKKYVSKVI